MDEPGSAVVYLRSAQDPASAFAAVRRTMREMDSNIPICNLRTLARQVERSLLTERIVATVSTAWGDCDAARVIGLYGLMAYTASCRTREIGVRMALGAVSGDVVWLVMREVVVLGGVGVVLGLAAALGLSRLIGNQLYGVSRTIPPTVRRALTRSSPSDTNESPRLTIVAATGTARFVPPANTFLSDKPNRPANNMEHSLIDFPRQSG